MTLSDTNDKCLRPPSGAGQEAIWRDANLLGPVTSGLCQLSGRFSVEDGPAVLHLHLRWRQNAGGTIRTFDCYVGNGEAFNFEVFFSHGSEHLQYRLQDIEGAVKGDLSRLAPLGFWTSLLFVARIRSRPMRRRWAPFLAPSGAGKQRMAHGVSRDLFGYWRYQKRIEPQLRQLANDCRQQLARSSSTPLITMFMHVPENCERLASKTMKSLRRQHHKNWQLYVLVQDKKNLAGLRVLASDAQIKAVAVADVSPDRISEGFLAVLSPGDRLHPACLVLAAAALMRRPAVQMLYTDEDRLNFSGYRSAPRLKSDWNHELLEASNYIGGLSLFARDRFLLCGGMALLAQKMTSHAFNKVFTQNLCEREICHLPMVLLHRTGGAAASGHFSPAKSAGPADRIPQVSVIIPTRDGHLYLKRCLDTLFERTAYPNMEVIVVDNQSAEEQTLRLLGQLRESGRARIISYDAAFNFSAICNLAVEAASGEVIALLNDDTEVLSVDWLSEMVRYALRPDVGAVGAKLYYPDMSIQHAGLGLGIGGVAGHLHLGAGTNASGYLNRLQYPQAVGAVTAACLVVERIKYEAVNGMDAQNLEVALNDVDLCLRLADRGWHCVWTPVAQLIHHEHKTRGANDTAEKKNRFRREHAFMRCRWKQQLASDSYYHPALTRARLDLGFTRKPMLQGVNWLLQDPETRAEASAE